MSALSGVAITVTVDRAPQCVEGALEPLKTLPR